MSLRSIRLAAALLLAWPAVHAESLEEVLAHLDANARTFKSFSARFAETDYEKVLDESDVSRGMVSMQRVKDALIGKLVYDDAHVAFFDGRNANLFYPKAKSVDIYPLDKETSQFVKLLLLGFGTTRADLQKDFDVSLGGAETVGGQASTRIVLKPKTAKQKQYMSQMELWISEGKGYPVQEKITEPSRNYKMFTYSNMQIPAPAGTAFEFNLPPGTKKVYPAH